MSTHGVWLRSLVLTSSALLAATGLAGCASGGEPESQPPPATSVDEPAQSAQPERGEAAEAEQEDTGTDRGGAAPDKDAAVKALESALGATAAWDGDVLRIEVKGSAETPVAYLHCSTVRALLHPGQKGVFVYPDGEVDCDDDPRLQSR